MSKRRITVDTLKAGQPRPYADTITHVRVTFEWQGVAGFSDKDAPYVPQDKFWNEARVRETLPGLCCGFPSKPPEGWWSTRLDWLKEVSPGVWEFHATTPFTD